MRRLAVIHSAVMSGGLTYDQRLMAVQPSNLIGYWPMDEASGTAAVDKSAVSGNGTYTGCTVGQVSSDAVATITCPYFDGNNDFMQFHSANFASEWNGNLYTLAGWAKMYSSTEWTDGAAHNIVVVYVDASNVIQLFKSATNNQLRMVRVAGGTNKTDNEAGLTYTTWFHWAMVCDQANDIFKTYINAVEISSLTGNGSWAGALSSNYQLLGASIAIEAIAANEWKGWQARFAVWKNILTQPEIAILATP